MAGRIGLPSICPTKTQTRMTDNTLATVLAAVAVISALTVASLVKKADRQRALARQAALPCPHCGQIYGPGIATTTTMVKYHWALAPGHTITSLRLPRSTFVVTCPHCSKEFEFRAEGGGFVHPQVGVLSFTRVRKSKAASLQPTSKGGF